MVCQMVVSNAHASLGPALASGWLTLVIVAHEAGRQPTSPSLVHAGALPVASLWFVWAMQVQVPGWLARCWKRSGWGRLHGYADIVLS